MGATADPGERAVTVPDRPTGTAAPAAPPRSARARLLSGSVVVALGLGVGQVLSYSLNLIAARVLPADQFGALGALLGIVLIAGTAALALQTVAARRVALMPVAQQRGAAHRVAQLSLRGALIVGGVLALLAPLFDHLFDLGGLAAPLLLAVTLLAMTASGGQLGLAQGGSHYWRLAWLYAISVGLRSVGGVVGAVVGRTVTTTMLGCALGALLAWGVGHLIVAALEDDVPAALPTFAVETLHVGHALLALFVLTNLDVLLARVYLPAALSGAYAVGVLMAKVAFFLPQFVTVVMFPRMAQSKDTRPVLLAAGATGALGLLLTAATALLSTLVVRILGGPAYLFLAPDMAWFAALGSLYALVQVLLYGRIAVGDRRAVAALWAGAAALLVAVSVWRHDSVEQIVSTALVIAVVLAAAGLVATVRAGRSGASTTPPLEPAGPATAQG